MNWSHSAPRWNCRRSLLAALAMVGFLASTAVAVAEDYKEFRPPDLISASEFKVLRGRVQGYLRAGIFTEPQQEIEFTKYYTYGVAQMTWVENIGNLPLMRAVLKFRQDLAISGRQAPDMTLHEKLNKLLLDGCWLFSNDPGYHPAVRVNFMLILGMLDQTEPDAGGQNGVPLQAALEKLQAAAADAKLSPEVRIAALVGIRRHATMNMTAKGRTDTIKLLTSDLKCDDAVGTFWMRRTAVEAMGIMAEKKWSDANKPEVARAAVSLLNDSEASLFARCEALRTIGCLEKGAFAATNAGQVLLSASKLTVDICKSTEDPEKRFMNSPENPQTKPVDVLAAQFYCIHTGLKGVDANSGLFSAANNETKQIVNDLDGKVTKMVEIASNTRKNIDDKLNDLRKEGTDLEQWIKSKVPGGAQVAAGGR
ncbi:MAG: hypothetical protein JSS27_17600 [Planctomycetes bacterium]|nr:hypothetical protein [Planctomycetota bacterium]